MNQVRRSRTGDSSKSEVARSLRKRVTEPFKKQSARQEEESDAPKLYQGKYGVYNGLSFETLKTFLEGRFPGYTFAKVHHGDYWLFETPEPLTEEDKKTLDKKALKEKAQAGSQDAGPVKRERKPSISYDKEQ